MPDPGETQTWLLLDKRPDYTATVPITRVITLADLGSYPDAEAPDYDPSNGCPEQFHTDPAYHPLLRTVHWPLTITRGRPTASG